MNGSPCLHDVKVSGIHELTEFQCGAKQGYVPGWITKPAANAAVYSPKAPAPEFTNYEPSSRLEHAGHFYNNPPKRSRWPGYDAEIAMTICLRLLNRESLRSICADAVEAEEEWQ
jgi:hypothetical protein